MRKARFFIRWVFGLAAVALLFSGCAQETLAPSASSASLSALRAAYRGASLIVTANCGGSLADAQGQPCVSLRVAEVLAGNAQAGDTLLCSGEGLKSGGNYLLYLQDNADAQSYALVEAVEWSSLSDSVESEGETLPLDALRTDIRDLQSVIGAPSETLYYGDIRSLVEASDAVFIGRVHAGALLSDMDFREESSTGTVEHTRPAAVVELEALGSIKGDIPYGDPVSCVYVPAAAADMLDAATLSPFGCTEADVPALNEGVHLFFLRRGPDAKQPYYFGVNPIQGHAVLQEDTLLAAPRNGALAPYESLGALLEALYAGEGPAA